MTLIEFVGKPGIEQFHVLDAIRVNGRDVPVAQDGWSVKSGNGQATSVTLEILPTEVRFVTDPVVQTPTPDICQQCGQDWSEPACGPTHAMIAAEQRVDVAVEPLGLGAVVTDREGDGWVRVYLDGPADHWRRARYDDTRTRYSVWGAIDVERIESQGWLP